MCISQCHSGKQVIYSAGMLLLKRLFTKMRGGESISKYPDTMGNCYYFKTHLRAGAVDEGLPQRNCGRGRRVPQSPLVTVNMYQNTFNDAMEIEHKEESQLTSEILNDHSLN